MSILDIRTYEEARRKFSWEQVWELFDGNEEQFNIAHECIDRHRDKGTAVRIKFDDGHTETYTFEQMADGSSQFAHALKDMGIKAGDRVAIMLDPCKEFYLSFFGTLKLGCQVVPCFTLFSPENVEYRLKDSGAKVLVTTEEKATLLGREAGVQIVTTGKKFEEFIKGKPETFTVHPTKAKDIAVLQYTSGTTKKFPEGVPHFHKSVYTAMPNAIFVIGLRPGDRYYAPASPAWGYGVWYATTAPLALGIAVGTYAGRFDEKRIMEALEEFQINNLSAAPTVLRRMMNSGLMDKYKFVIEKISYSGEPLDLKTFEYFKEKLGVAPCGFYGSTEVGVILANFGGFKDWVVKPGALGKPMMGLEVAVVDESGNPVPPGVPGEIVVKRRGQWFYVKDIGVVDEDGYFMCKGRSDDVIISAGWTISSAEIESVLSTHKDVEEAAVIPVPDEDRGYIARAYVKSKRKPDEEFVKELQDFVKEHLGRYEYPRQIEFLETIPKTVGGKIDRRILKQMAGS